MSGRCRRRKKEHLNKFTTSIDREYTTRGGSLKAAEGKFKQLHVIILEFKALNLRDLISSQLDQWKNCCDEHN